MAEQRRIPAVEGLFTWPSESPRLIGGRCNGCGTYFFPSFALFHKPDCEGGPVEEVLLASRGKLVSYTVQYYPPPPPYVAPDPFPPMPIGTVELPEGLQIPGQITGCKIEDLRTGIDVEIVIDDLFVDEEGNQLLTWKFRPLQP